MSVKKFSNTNIVDQKNVVEVSQELNTIEVSQELNTIDVYTTVGAKGLSAYEVWLREGNSGTAQEFLDSLIGGNHTHHQMIPSDSWIIEHNLSFYPNVTSFSSADEQVFGDVTHVDTNKVIITFSGSLSGKAYLS